MADSLHSDKIYVTARLLSQPCEKEKKQTIYKIETDTRRARIKARKTSAFRGNIIYHTRDVSRTDWRPFNLSLMGYGANAPLSDPQSSRI